MSSSAPRLTLPNILTLSRIGAVPVVVLLLQFGRGGKAASYVSAVFFLAAALTDLLDGILARRSKQVTNLGRFLDPLADKLLLSAALIMLIHLGRAPAWMVFMIIGREIAVTGLRGIAVDAGLVIAADKLGKIKAVFQSAASFALLWHYPFLGLDAAQVGYWLLWIALILTYWSGYNYFKGFARVFQEKTNAEKGLDKPDENV